MQGTMSAEQAVSLVERIASGDRAAEQELVTQYERGLRFILLRSCNRDETLVSDIAQETWSVVFTALRQSKLRDPSKLSSFIIQTGKNLAIAHYRKIENKSSKFVANEDLEHADNTQSPVTSLERYNLCLLVKQVILELDQPRDRELMYRLYVKEQEKKTICQDLVLDAVHFDRVLYRAKQRFKTLWESRFGKS